MNKSDTAVVRLLPRVSVMISQGLKPEHVSPQVRPYVRAAASISLKGHPVEWLTVRLVAAGKHDAEIKEEFGKGGVDLNVAVNSALSWYVSSQLGPIADHVRSMLASSPDDVTDWLPSVYNKIGGLVKDGVVYDATPSEHFKQPIPQIKFQLGCFLDDVFRGGVYGGAIGAIASAPGGGKSTMAYTIAAWCMSKSVMTVFITGEETEQYVAGRVLMAQTHHNLEEMLQFQQHKLTGESDLDGMTLQRLEAALVSQDRNLRIYNQEQGMDVSKMDSILAWERPDVLIVDHIMMVQDAKKASKTFNPAFDIGDRIYKIRHMVVQKYPCQGIIFSQLPAAAVKMLKSGGKPTHVTLYGSEMIDQAAHWTALMYRHPSSLRQSHARLWYQKSKLAINTYGLQDCYSIEHSMQSQSFVGGEPDRWS